MKKSAFVFVMIFALLSVLSGCAIENAAGNNPPEPAEGDVSERQITEELAYEGVYHYCRSAYDWSAAEENPGIMYVEPGEETEEEYQVIFRSYTGALVCFYVDKVSGTARLVECVPSLGIEEETGTIELYDYLE